jgi:hypothetical protein
VAGGPAGTGGGGVGESAELFATTDTGAAAGLLCTRNPPSCTSRGLNGVRRLRPPWNHQPLTKVMNSVQPARIMDATNELL